MDARRTDRLTADDVDCRLTIEISRVRRELLVIRQAETHRKSAAKLIGHLLIQIAGLALTLAVSRNFIGLTVGAAPGLLIEAFDFIRKIA